jgi:hypothetical protein
MKEDLKTVYGTPTHIREFTSLDEFNKYITWTPINEAFRWTELSSVKTNKYSYSWTQTHSYSEAMELFKNGWNDMAKEITHRLEVIKDVKATVMVNKMMFDIVGYQASVPRYLQGIPTSMVNTKRIAQKQKVITIDKDISYNSMIESEDIIESSIQTLQLIKKIEAQGIRVNLNLIWGDGVPGTAELVKIRLKSAGERLNISKLAFPLVHPSMLRRLLFRYVEVAPSITRPYTSGYGKPFDGARLQEFTKGEYLLPRLFDGDITKLGSLKEIANLTSDIVNGENDKPKIK